MRLVALDQSLSSCGYAVWDSGTDLPRSGAWPLCEGVQQRALAFIGLRRELIALHKEQPIDIIAHERALKMPSDKLDKLIALYGLVATIEAFARARRLTLYSVTSQAWRSTWFNGMQVEGRSDLKRIAIERARQFGMNPLTHDEAEACGLLDHVMHAEKITPPWRLEHPMVAML